MSGRSATLKVGKRAMIVAKPPRERLRDIRERAGFSGSQVARDLGYASAPGYLRYEQKSEQGDKPVPYDVVKKLIPLFKGRGDPPVTAEEMLALTDAKDIPSPLTRAFEAVVSDGDGLVNVKYRVERDVYVRTEGKAYGASRIGVLSKYPKEDQFVAVVVDDSEPTVPSGTQLVCVAPNNVSTHALRGRRVLVGKTVSDGVIEVSLGKIGTDGTAFTLGGLPLEGTILGVVVGSFVPE